jgi:hypothetical protein
MNSVDNSADQRLAIIRRAFHRQVNYYTNEPVDLANVQRAKRSSDRIMRRLLAMHDTG